MKISKQALEKIVKSEIDLVVSKIMEKFDDEIVEFEDPEDPARPSLCRDEFEQFIRETIDSNLIITNKSIEIGVGDENKLGFGERLDEDTTDCIKIIGTIIQGISGTYVLVTRQMAGESVGRFGGAFIMPIEIYKAEAEAKGWDPNKEPWSYSNFAGVPNFFGGLELKDLVKRIIERITEAIK